MCDTDPFDVILATPVIANMWKDSNWAVAGPELVRVISEFEATMVVKQQNADQRNHHEQTRSAQLLFARHVHAVVTSQCNGWQGQPIWGGKPGS